MLEYEELRLRAWTLEPGRYLLLASGPAVGAQVTAVDNPKSYAKEFERLLEEGFTSSGKPRGDTTRRLRQLGREIFELLFPQPLDTCFYESINRANHLNRGLRVRFDLPDALAKVPVETMCTPPSSPVQALAKRQRLSIVREVRGEDLLAEKLPTPESRTRPLSLIVAVTSGGTPLAGVGEVDDLKLAIKKVSPSSERALSTLGLPGDLPATRANLTAALGAQADAPCALLVVAHGAFDGEGGQGVIYLDDESGQPDPVPADAFADVVGDAVGLRLVVLNLCWGTAAEPSEPFSALAHAVVGNGVPAVVAMKAEVSDAAAARFSPTLFRRIVSNLTIDEAVASARLEMGPSIGIEFATPTLYLHQQCRHGWLFKVQVSKGASGAVDVDPLVDGCALMARAQPSEGNPEPADQAAAARFARATVNRLDQAGTDVPWDTVQYLATFAVSGDPHDHTLPWLVREAEVELAVRRCALLSEHAVNSDLSEKDMASFPAEVRDCLIEERGWRVLFRSAKDHEANEESVEAVAKYRELAQEGPTYRTADREVGQLYCEAGLVFADGADWPEVVAAYGRVIAKRRDAYPNAHTRRCYARGRVAEELDPPDWVAAADCYAKAQGVGDQVEGRLANASGRIAEQEATSDPTRWREAESQYLEAERLGISVGVRRVMACGRAAELDGRWDLAVDAYTERKDDPAVGRRLAYARGWLALKGGDREGLLASLGCSTDDDPEVTEWRQEAYSYLAGEARRACDEGDWAAVEVLLAQVPDTLHDSRARRAYACGRAEEKEGHWRTAAKAFGSARKFEDAPRRRISAQAHLHEANGEWRKAVDQLKKLPKAVDPALDIGLRLRYALGRWAEKEQDWDGVVVEFGGFDDGPPDVACRLAVARARIEAKASKWGKVIDALAGVDTGSCAADAEAMAAVVTGLRLLAEGRLAEEKEPPDWPAAERTYLELSGLAPDDADAAHRLYYAKGRQAEKPEHWNEAAAAYDGAPPELHDLRWRAPYARGRFAEEDGRWGDAVKAYEDVTAAVAAGLEHPEWASAPELSEIPVLAGYARARRAEKDELWVDLEREATGLGTYSDAPQLVAYARGRTEEEAGRWEEAVAAYQACTDRAAVRIGYAWARHLEDIGDWSAAIEMMAPLVSVIEEVEARHARLVRLRELLPWADGLAGCDLVADPAALADPTFPYGALMAAGITSRSSAQEVKDGSYVLMEREAATPDEWQAWHAVRFPAERLKVDAFLYRLVDRAGLAGALRRLSAEIPADELVEDLCRSVPADAPLVRRLAGHREHALAQWDDQWRASPADPVLAHSLACGHYWWARELEARGEWDGVEARWRHAIASWALVLTDDDFWEAWRRGRADCFREAVTRTDASRLRRNLSQRLADELAGRASAAAEEGHGPRAHLYQGLALALEVELESARALKEVGGLAVPGGATMAGGVLCIERAGLEWDLAALVAKLEAAQESDMASTIVLGVAPTSPLTLRRLRLLFSALAGPAVLVDHGEPERALRLLPQLEGRTLSNLPPDCEGPSMTGDRSGHADGCEFCARVGSESPAYLLLGRRQARIFQDAVDIATNAHLSIAHAALTSGPGRTDEAISRWRTAIALSEAAGSQVRKKQAIVRVVIGRIDALREAQGPRRGERLDEAVDLVDRALPVVGAVDRAQLRAKAAEVLTSRGIWLGYGCIEFDMRPDYEGAAADLRRSLDMNPDSLHTRDNLARALVFRAAGIDDPARADQRLALLSEGYSVLHDGLNRTGPHRQLLQMLDEALNGLRETVLGELTDGQLATWVADTAAGPSDGTDPSGRADRLARDAEEKLQDGDAVGALLALISACKARPQDELLRQSLLAAIHQRRSPPPEERT